MSDLGDALAFSLQAIKNQRLYELYGGQGQYTDSSHYKGSFIDLEPDQYHVKDDSMKELSSGEYWMEERIWQRP